MWSESGLFWQHSAVLLGNWAAALVLNTGHVHCTLSLHTVPTKAAWNTWRQTGDHRTLSTTGLWLYTFQRLRASSAGNVLAHSCRPKFSSQSPCENPLWLYIVIPVLGTQGSWLPLAYSLAYCWVAGDVRSLGKLVSKVREKFGWCFRNNSQGWLLTSAHIYTHTHVHTHTLRHTQRQTYT